MASAPGRAGGRLSAGAGWLKSRALGPRPLLALKAALAAGIAWTVAPLMPGVVDDYPYYAPLGALISMYPTLMGSARAGLQTLAGLAMGILLAGAVLLFGDPTLFSIAAAVGLGVLVAGFGWLGAGQEYVPMAAMFVLILGGPNAENYSIGYLVQMSVGVAVGLGVNALIFPPLNFDAAVLRLSGFRHTLAGQLEDIGEALTESWPPEHEDWADRHQSLARGAAEVRRAVNHAEESRRGNPRARRHRRDLGRDYQELRALEKITFYVRDMTEVLSAAVWGRPFTAELPAELCAPLSDAMHAAAALLREWDALPEQDDPTAQADAVMGTLWHRIDEQRHLGARSLTPAASCALALSRIIDTIRGQIRPEDHRP